MNTMRKEEETGSEVELLLPWHAAGTLNRRDAARVEQALANDNDLARRYELVREELGEAIRLNESLGAPSARAMQKLFAKIDAEPARAPRASFNFGTWLSGFVSGFAPRTLAYAGAAAAIALVLQAGVLTSLLMKDGTYGVASHGAPGTTATGSFVLIRFNPDATAADISKFLSENKASIVGGPNAGTGLFRLQVAEKAVSQAELGDIVKRMAQDRKVVGFTVPAAQP